MTIAVGTPYYSGRGCIRDSTLDGLAGLLKGADETRHSVSVLLSSALVELEVDGVGEVRLPLRPAQVKQLIAAARPAHFGRGEETVLDRRVRDTWELTPGQFRLSGPAWPAALHDALEEMGSTLGLPRGARLEAEPHSLLVYGKGQFFAPHQDSEKLDDMVATLVMTLPSNHSGGELVIDDQGRSTVYGGSREQLTLVAFYADRRHEIQPVRSGHRVSITFNLRLSAGPVEPAADIADRASALLVQHFATPRVDRYSDEVRTPSRLVVLLDHEYSRHGLDAGTFKGADADRVALLRAAAGAADCRTAFAQAEQHQTWDAQVSFGYGEGGRWDDDDGDDDDVLENDDDVLEVEDIDLGELIDDDTTLTWWNDDETSGEITLAVDQDDWCSPTPALSLRPVSAEYEGYMGNYGNTVDRWYRRAAVVVWPTVRTFALRAEVNPAWALRSLLEQTKAGDLDGARSNTRALTPFWKAAPSSLFRQALAVAAELRDPTTARIMLEPFRLELTTVDDAPLLAGLAHQYDRSWWLPLLQHWDSRHHAPDLRLRWMSDVLPAWSQSLDQHHAGELAVTVAGWLRDWLAVEIRLAVALPDPARRLGTLAELGPALGAVLANGGDEVAGTIVTTLSVADDEHLPLVVSALRSSTAPTSATRALAVDAVQRLSRRLAAPPRAEDDWSIDWTPASDPDERRLGEFLHSPTDRTLSWPLAQSRREHVQRLVEVAGLPVTHRTVRQGRPYTLVLEKTAQLFTREAAALRQSVADHRWLIDTFELPAQRTPFST